MTMRLHASADSQGSASGASLRRGVACRSGAYAPNIRWMAAISASGTGPIEAGTCCATALRKASRRLTQLYDNALMPSGLRSTQFAILAEVCRRAGAPPSVQDLAAALVLDRSALGHNLRPLERDGLLALKKSPDDRRRRHVVLTRKGLARFEATKPLWQGAQERFTCSFGEKEAAMLRATLLTIAGDESLAALQA